MRHLFQIGPPHLEAHSPWWIPWLMCLPPPVEAWSPWYYSLLLSSYNLLVYKFLERLLMCMLMILIGTSFRRDTATIFLPEPRSVFLCLRAPTEALAPRYIYTFFTLRSLICSLYLLIGNAHCYILFICLIQVQSSSRTAVMGKKDEKNRLVAQSPNGSAGTLAPSPVGSAGTSTVNPVASDNNLGIAQAVVSGTLLVITDNCSIVSHIWMIWYIVEGETSPECSSASSSPSFCRCFADCSFAYRLRKERSRCRQQRVQGCSSAMGW